MFAFYINIYLKKKLEEVVGVLRKLKQTRSEERRREGGKRSKSLRCTRLDPAGRVAGPASFPPYSDPGGGGPSASAPAPTPAGRGASNRKRGTSSKLTLEFFHPRRPRAQLSFRIPGFGVRVGIPTPGQAVQRQAQPGRPSLAPPRAGPASSRSTV
jgi:hypothetical protein